MTQIQFPTVTRGLISNVPAPSESSDLRNGQNPWEKVCTEVTFESFVAA